MSATVVVKPRLAVVASHAIQYQIPLFRALSRVLDLHVFFAQRQSPKQQANAGFRVAFEWDLDLFEGYAHTFLENRAKLPDTQSYFGCDTPEIAQRLASGEFDAVLTMGWYLKSYVQTVRVCERLGLPVMVRGDSTLQAQKSAVIRAAKAIFFPSFMRRFDAFLVVGQRSKSYLEYYGVTEDRMFWSPHAVDNDRFAAGVREACHARNVVREDLECQPDEFVVLFVGKFVSLKRPLDLVGALSIVGNEGIRVRGVFVGDGPLGVEIRLASERLNVAITLVGFKNQSELPAIYAAADILILPSGQETWGLVVNEAMACGTPAIVSSGVGCAEDLIEAGETGYQYPVGDVRALAQSIRKLLPISGSERVRQALERKMSAYSLERAAEGIVNAANHGRKH